jgi:UDP-N-acetylmuramoylalanine--D-glutamate ligase
VNYKDYFKDRKIAIIGLGPHGEMIADIKFLLRNKAQVSLFDMRSEERIKKYVMSLSVGGLSKYSFGSINGDDLLGFDLIILSPEISKKSTFLKKAIEANIQIEFPDTIFLKLAPPVIIVGVIGLYGKSTVAHLIYGMLKKSFLGNENQGLFIIDSESTSGALTHLKKIKKDDLVLVRIPEHLLDYYHSMRMSPHVAVITSVVSFKILEFQTQNNFIVASDSVVDSIKSKVSFTPRAKILRTRAGSIPEDWGVLPKFVHNRENAALAVQTVELFKVSKEIMKEVLHEFIGLRGHIEFVKKFGGAEYYNDASSTTPQATLSALRALAVNKNIVLIFGGAYTGHDYDELINNFSQYVSTLILIAGSGTIGLREKIEKLDDIKCIHVLGLEQAVRKSKDYFNKGDVVLYSPGCDAVGVDISRKERGERFVKAVRNL